MEDLLDDIDRVESVNVQQDDVAAGDFNPHSHTLTVQIGFNFVQEMTGVEADEFMEDALQNLSHLLYSKRFVRNVICGTVPETAGTVFAHIDFMKNVSLRNAVPFVVFMLMSAYNIIRVAGPVIAKHTPQEADTSVFIGGEKVMRFKVSSPKSIRIALTDMYLWKERTRAYGSFRRICEAMCGGEVDKKQFEHEIEIVYKSFIETYRNIKKSGH